MPIKRHHMADLKSDSSIERLLQTQVPSPIYTEIEPVEQFVRLSRPRKVLKLLRDRLWGSIYILLLPRLAAVDILYVWFWAKWAMMRLTE